MDLNIINTCDEDSHIQEDDTTMSNQRLGLRRRNIFPTASSKYNPEHYEQYHQQQQQQEQQQQGQQPLTKQPQPLSEERNDASFLPNVELSCQNDQDYHHQQRLPQQELHVSPIGTAQSSPSTTTTIKEPPLTSFTTFSSSSSFVQPQSKSENNNKLYTYSSDTPTGQCLTYITNKLKLNKSTTRSGSALPGFLALLLLTMANYMLSPMRDAAALAVGVSYIPILTLASTCLAIASSVPMGWLFEAPNPTRSGKHWRDRIGLTRGETQGTSLALFLRCFAICLIGYAITFKLFEWFDWNHHDRNRNDGTGRNTDDLPLLVDLFSWIEGEGLWAYLIRVTGKVLQKFGKVTYVAFFLVVHLMKLHSLSLIWGVTSEAMEYEEQAENRERRRQKLKGPQNSKFNHHDEAFEASDKPSTGKQSRVRLKRLAFVGFGGTLGGIIGSVFVSMTTHKLRLSGLLIVAAVLLLLSAELSIELGQIMLRYWEEEQIEKSLSDDDLLSLSQDSGMSSTFVSDHRLGETMSSTAEYPTIRQVKSSGALAQEALSSEVDSCMKKVSSYGSLGMKRVASQGSMMRVGSGGQLNTSIDSCIKKVSSNGSMKRVASGNSIASIRKAINSQNSLNTLDEKNTPSGKVMVVQNSNIEPNQMDNGEENTFKQRLLRGITTILRSRLLMTIFTYNALYATTNTLLSFQRAELIANRSTAMNNMQSDTAFLARINIISSLAVFALQASGMGAFIASGLGQRGTLSLMPMVRMFGVAMLILWHIKADGTSPNLTFFLILDEFTKVINFAVAKPVRESLWRGLSNEARYEAKPIVDTLANRWGSGSAAVLMSLLDRIMSYTGVGRQLDDGTQTLFGFPPLLILCGFTAAWWAFVSADLGYIRHRIDLELKKQL